MTSDERVNTVDPEGPGENIWLCFRDFDFEMLKSIPVWTGLVCFSSLRGALITLIRFLALVDFSCIAGTNLAVCRQVELTQMIPFQHVDYANSTKQFETLFCLILLNKPPIKL